MRRRDPANQAVAERLFYAGILGCERWACDLLAYPPAALLRAVSAPLPEIYGE